MISTNLMFQTKEKCAEKQQTPTKRGFTRTTCNDGPVVECLLNMILTKTNRHFRGLCEGLERTGQGFIVKQCLSKQGKESRFILNVQSRFIVKQYLSEQGKVSKFILDI